MRFLAELKVQEMNDMKKGGLKTHTTGPGDENQERIGGGCRWFVGF